jgi:23S rRNA pseudouridine1911/1915/1917 synthase
MPLQVLLEDEHCLAVLKPAGQFVQGIWAPPGAQTLEQEVRAHLNPLEPALVYLGIVHRLDRPVSGVLIWAKTEKAARRLSVQFQRRSVRKEYWAIVEETGSPGASGKLAPENSSENPEGTWIDWLTAPGVSGVVKALPPQSEGTRQAVTRYRFTTAERIPTGMRWLRLWPETGRTHQLRIQTALRGLPILGDTPYGANRSFPIGIALHARALRVRHPILQIPLELTARLPDHWADAGMILDPEQLG